MEINFACSHFNSLFVERCDDDIKCENFNHNFPVGILGIQVNITPRFMPDDLVND